MQDRHGRQGHEAGLHHDLHQGRRQVRDQEALMRGPHRPASALTKRAYRLREDAGSLPMSDARPGVRLLKAVLAAMGEADRIHTADLLADLGQRGPYTGYTPLASPHARGDASDPKLASPDGDGPDLRELGSRSVSCGKTGTLCSAHPLASRSARRRIGASGRRSSPRRMFVMPAGTTPGTPRRPCYLSREWMSGRFSRSLATASSARRSGTPT